MGLLIRLGYISFAKLYIKICVSFQIWTLQNFWGKNQIWRRKILQTHLIQANQQFVTAPVSVTRAFQTKIVNTLFQFQFLTLFLHLMLVNNYPKKISQLHLLFSTMTWQTLEILIVTWTFIFAEWWRKGWLWYECQSSVEKRVHRKRSRHLHFRRWHPNQSPRSGSKLRKFDISF